MAASLIGELEPGSTSRRSIRILSDEAEIYDAGDTAVVATAASLSEQWTTAFEGTSLLALEEKHHIT